MWARGPVLCFPFSSGQPALRPFEQRVTRGSRDKRDDPWSLLIIGANVWLPKPSGATQLLVLQRRKGIRGRMFTLLFFFILFFFFFLLSPPSNFCRHCRGVTYCPSGERHTRGKGNHVVRASLSKQCRTPSNLSNAKHALRSSWVTLMKQRPFKIYELRKRPQLQ